MTITGSRQAIECMTPKAAPPAAPDSRDDQDGFDSHSLPVVAGTTSGEGRENHEPHITPALAGSDHRLDQTRTEAQSSHVEPVSTSPPPIRLSAPTDRSAAGPSSTGSGHAKPDAHTTLAAAGTNLPADHPGPGAHTANVGGDQTEDGSAATTQPAAPIQRPSLADPFLALAADVLDDTERTRIANENRLRQLTRTATDADGEERGFGLDESHPDVARLAALVDALGRIEHDATLNLQRALRRHPLGPWCKAQKGIGEKQAARLLAVVGDPCWHSGENRLRLVSELWSYCGHGDSTRRIRKGMTQADLLACGSPLAKMRVHLIAEACLKAQGHYADVYYARKDVNEGRLHATECKRCGPSGHPAQPGSPWSDAHRHADALRITAKEILCDLWAEARRLHAEEELR